MRRHPSSFTDRLLIDRDLLIESCRPSLSYLFTTTQVKSDAFNFVRLSVHDSGLKSEEKARKDAVNLITMSRGLEIRNPMRFYPILLAADTNFAPFKS